MSFKVKRLGVLMEPDPSDPREVEGVLNPAVIRGKDGHLYIFPRLVARGNYSRIGVGRVVFSAAGDPVGVERLGIALEPETDYEQGSQGQAGCEDPRISYVEALGHYVMTYSAVTPTGPRIAVAKSDDLIHWTRLGLAHLHPYKGISLTLVDDKDAGVFPELIQDPDGVPSVALVHRPMFDHVDLVNGVAKPKSLPKDLALESIWVSYWHMNAQTLTPTGRQFVAHRRLARPEFTWENAKIGIGAPPVRCRHGWLLVYHGVEKTPTDDPAARGLTYRAGVMVLAADDIHKVIYRAPEPILSPETPQELRGAVDAVVFPSGLDSREDIGQPDRYDLYYGMADNRIGVARLTVPATLPG
jgi:predicted GH43/DUF377 family glycosyl hydrolase